MKPLRRDGKTINSTHLAGEVTKQYNTKFPHGECEGLTVAEVQRVLRLTRRQLQKDKFNGFQIHQWVRSAT